jgi:hypothetical protein
MEHPLIMALNHLSAQCDSGGLKGDLDVSLLLIICRMQRLQIPGKTLIYNFKVYGATKNNT